MPEITLSRKRNIARDFHLTSLTNKEISDKYDIGITTANNIARDFPYQSIYKEKPKTVIKIAVGDYQKAMIILQENGIETHEVAPSFELLEYYESSIK